ncbi:MAG TPA: 2OG-Fe(II) oxygenase family protein [Pseudomonadales bacterium]|nr:2OG-Fe(II) oxygenase family protein [Pseudomonadales bacterium]
MSGDLKLMRIFTTPIATHRLPDCAKMNAELTQLITDMEQRSASTGRSNVGGWRSDNRLLDSDEFPIKTLRAHIQSVVMQMVQATTGEQGFRGYMKINGWANVLRHGNYNTLHNHPDSVWSGVYYVHAGSQTGASLSGVLELVDPRPAVAMVSAPGSLAGMPVRIQPEAGLMVLFPSWLQHQVHPYWGDEARVAIAFNVPMAVQGF